MPQATGTQRLPESRHLLRPNQERTLCWHQQLCPQVQGWYCHGELGQYPQGLLEWCTHLHSSTPAIDPQDRRHGDRSMGNLVYPPGAPSTGGDWAMSQAMSQSRNHAALPTLLIFGYPVWRRADRSVDLLMGLPLDLAKLAINRS
eukprot:g47574.t1